MADEDDLYGVLGVSQHSPDSDIKKAYHRLARQYHPDKNPGYEDKFKSIQFAYEVLSNPEKRQMYDQFGISAVKDGGGDSGASVFTRGFGAGGDIFSSLFGGGDPFGRRRRAKAETIGIPLEVTMEELYIGATKSVEYKRKVLCKPCSGTGGRKAGSVTRCRKCSGTGISVTHRPIGHQMVQQIQSTCTDCGGTGDFVREKDRCKKCKGKKLNEVDYKLEVPVSPGMKHEQRIPFRGEADEMPDGDAGDVIVILQQMDHTTLRREGVDLFLDKKITLHEALCGLNFLVYHLDGRKLLVKCLPGEVVSPGSVKGIIGEGMPQYRHPDIHGNMYITFEIEFPVDGFLDEENLIKLEQLLPAKPDEPIVGDDAEEVHLLDLADTKGMDAMDEEDSDEGEMAGGPRVGCAHQ